MKQRTIDRISGAVGAIMIMVFVVGLADGITSGFAGFWGGLPFWVIIVVSLALVWYDYWDSCLRRN